MEGQVCGNRTLRCLKLTTHTCAVLLSCGNRPARLVGRPIVVVRPGHKLESSQSNPDTRGKVRAKHKTCHSSHPRPAPIQQEARAVPTQDFATAVHGGKTASQAPDLCWLSLGLGSCFCRSRGHAICLRLRRSFGWCSRRLGSWCSRRFRRGSGGRCSLRYACLRWRCGQSRCRRSLCQQHWGQLGRSGGRRYPARLARRSVGVVHLRMRIQAKSRTGVTVSHIS